MLHLAVFAADTGVVGALAWLITCASGHARHDPLEAGVAWGWSALAVVAGSGIALGLIGQLEARGFLAAHALALGALLAARRPSLARARAAWNAHWRNLRDTLSIAGAERWAVGALVLALLGLLTLAAWAQPVVYDGLTYRLPRIGAWLQSGSITMLTTADSRLNYMPVVPDVVMAWLLGATSSGYSLLAVAQALGGILTVSATVGLARESGLSRRAALFAGGSLFGMPNVLGQFTSTHTDLFTTGVFAAAVYLGQRALRRNEIPWLGATGLGLAWGAKGTVVYYLPGLALWLGWLAWQQRPRGRRWFEFGAVTFLGLAVFAGPGMLRNWESYGSLLAPADAIRKHQRIPDSAPDLAQKLGRNLLASLAQVFEPNSQPIGLQETGRLIGSALASRLPIEDSDAFEARGRRITLDEIFTRHSPDADVTSFGIPAALLFLVGAVLAAGRIREPRATPILVWTAGTMAFAFCFHAVQQWHGYGFRFFVLAAPWMAIIGTWGLAQLARRWRLALGGATFAAGATTAWTVLVHTHQVGWSAVSQPTQSRGFYVYQNWRDWARALDPGAPTLSIALPVNLPLAAFFRQPQTQKVNLAPDPPAAVATAEQLAPVDYSWVVVPVARFLGREGKVAARTWLFRGEETSLFSLAAYRRLRPGERTEPVLYRHRLTRQGNEVAHELLVKSGGAPSVAFAFMNPGASSRDYVVLTPLARTTGRLAAGERLVVKTSLPPDTVSEIRILFARDTPAGVDEVDPLVELQWEPRRS